MSRRSPKEGLDGARARQLREEAEATNFVFTCEACVHYAPDDAPPRCSLGYPLNLDAAASRGSDRSADSSPGSPIIGADDWTFCKYFELN